MQQQVWLYKNLFNKMGQMGLQISRSKAIVTRFNYAMFGGGTKSSP